MKVSSDNLFLEENTNLVYSCNETKQVQQVKSMISELIIKFTNISIFSFQMISSRNHSREFQKSHVPEHFLMQYLLVIFQLGGKWIFDFIKFKPSGCPIQSHEELQSNAGVMLTYRSKTSCLILSQEREYITHQMSLSLCSWRSGRCVFRAAVQASSMSLLLPKTEVAMSVTCLLIFTSLRGRKDSFVCGLVSGQCWKNCPRGKESGVAQRFYSKFGSQHLSYCLHEKTARWKLILQRLA